MPVINTESFLKKINLVKKKKTKNFNMHAIYVTIFLNVKNVETFPKKKTTKSVNMLVIVIEKFLEALTFSGTTKSYFHLKVRSFRASMR